MKTGTPVPTPMPETLTTWLKYGERMSTHFSDLARLHYKVTVFTLKIKIVSLRGTHTHTKRWGERDRKREEREVSHMYWCTLHMLPAAGTRLGWSQKLGTQSRVLTWVAGTQLLELSLLPPWIHISRKLESVARAEYGKGALMCRHLHPCLNC